MKDEFKHGKKIETQNLFHEETYEGEQISKIPKKKDFYFPLSDALKDKKIDLSEKTIENFKKIFEYIMKLEDENLSN